MLKNRLKPASVLFFAPAFIGYLITLYYYREADQKENGGLGGLGETIRALIFFLVSSVFALTGIILRIVSRKRTPGKSKPDSKE